MEEIEFGEYKIKSEQVTECLKEFNRWMRAAGFNHPYVVSRDMEFLGELPLGISMRFPKSSE